MTAFEEYVDQYGPHFDKKLYEFAVGMMKDRNGNKVQMPTKEQVADWLRAHGVTLKNDKGHDAAYVLAMIRGDAMGSSITDDQHLALGVKDFLDDVDGYPSKAFDYFVMGCRRKGEPIFWDEMM